MERDVHGAIKVETYKWSDKGGCGRDDRRVIREDAKGVAAEE